MSAEPPPGAPVEGGGAAVGPRRPPSGVLVVDKPAGPTSHDLVAQARRVFRTRAVGHAGTLDPAATGVLVLLVGDATRLAPVFSAARKRYQARVALGASTASDDAAGEVTARAPVPADWLARLPAALAAERARTLQTPPAVSAISVDGQRAHAAARAGTPLALAPRPVAVHALEPTGHGPAQLDLAVDVDKGYYVRALARDLGPALGTLAHLAALRRTASGPFTLEEAQPWPPPPGAPAPALLAPGEAVRRVLPVGTLNDEGVRRVRLGQPIDARGFDGAPPPPEGTTAWLDAGGALVALGEHADGYYRPRRVFA